MALIPEQPAEYPVPPPPSSEMSAREKNLRDLFVAEYLIDYHSVAAAMRCGFTRTHAAEWAGKLMDEPYVQQRLKAIELTPGDTHQERDFNVQRIKQQLMREAHYRGPGSSHAARVSALKELKAIYGMDAAKKIEGRIEHRGGVMRVPSASATLEDWENLAQQSQEDLKNGKIAG